MRERSAIEAQLALGVSFSQAMRGLVRGSVRRALLPIINQMSAAGVVTLPGIMTGQILAGMDPLEAAKYQILLIFLLSGGSGLAAVAVVYLAAMRLTDDRQRLRIDRLAARTKGSATMIASDVMTRNVISVSPDATVADAVELMLERGISGLFVVDASGTLAGIVTEGDLLRRDELGTERRRSWWLRLIASPGRQAADFTRTHGRKVTDVMTRDVLSVNANAPLEDIVALMEEHRIKRVPVLDGDHVVGVVSRADLLRALSVAARGGAGGGRRTIRDRILDRWHAKPGRRRPR